MKRESKESAKIWKADELLELGRSYQAAAVFAAAADLELFDALVRPMPAKDLAQRLHCDFRALVILLDALVALQLLEKDEDIFFLSPQNAPFLTASGSQSILAMAQHQANCLRNWAQLARVLKNGLPADRIPSVRGEWSDRGAFIGAMHDVSAPIADQLIEVLKPIRFRHLLDIGGASGTWTIAFLRANPSAKATLFDLPHVIPMARQRLRTVGLMRRVQLAQGDFERDTLPAGADLAWVSAIVHQNSRNQNRALFVKVFRALMPGGRIAIRDLLMDPTRTRPLAGALFAVNMLVATKGGATFTFAELREDLAAAGFSNASILHEDAGMNSIVVAEKPAEG